MDLYKSRGHALSIGLVFRICCYLFCCWVVAFTSPCVCGSVCIECSCAQHRQRPSLSVTRARGSSPSVLWVKAFRSLYKRLAGVLADASFSGKSITQIYSHFLDHTLFPASQPPRFMMFGLAFLAIPLVMRAVSDMTGSGDIASAAPAASLDVADVAIKASPGCTIDHTVSLDTTLNVTLGNRRYLLYFPVNYKPDEPAPLVLSYHGGTRTAETQLALDRLTTTFFNKDHIIVYPNGIGVRPCFFPLPQSQCIDTCRR